MRQLSRDTSVAMPPHSDGFAFGDEAPDRLLLFGARPAAEGGESFLIDGLKVLEVLAEDRANAELVTFLGSARSEPAGHRGRL
jgi:hypothetical protein